MAYYPLKVKDGAGTTHTVGDPRINTEGAIPQSSINGLDTALAGKVDTTDSRLSDTRTPTDNSVTSAKIVDGSIVNADVNASAAIALSKLATGALPTGITVASANIVNGTIVDADVNASAAIAQSKISGLTSALAAKLDASAYTPGLSHLTTQSFSAVSTVSVNSVFDATYTNYLVLFRLTMSSATGFAIRCRASGSDTSSNYGKQYLQANGSSVVAAGSATGQTSVPIGLGGASEPQSGSIEIGSPAVAVPTIFRGDSFAKSNEIMLRRGVQYDNTAYDGFSLICDSGTFTGVVSVYGYAIA